MTGPSRPGSATFQYERCFPRPHQIGPDDVADAIGETIQSVAFDVPAIRVYTELRFDVRSHRTQTITAPHLVYEAGTESMVAIRKRA